MILLSHECGCAIGPELLGVFFVPLLIFVARIIEASLETVRTIYISKGHGDLAAYVGIVKTGHLVALHRACPDEPG